MKSRISSKQGKAMYRMMSDLIIKNATTDKEVYNRIQLYLLEQYAGASILEEREYKRYIGLKLTKLWRKLGYTVDERLRVSREFSKHVEKARQGIYEEFDPFPEEKPEE